MDLRGKVALITGASSGIGAELARQLAARGARLSLLARRAERLEAVAAELRGAGADVLTLPADVTVAESVQEAVAATVNHFGRLDVLVNNAGLGYFGPLERMDIADFDRVVKTNLYGVLYATQAAIPHLKQSRGMVVNVSSSLSKRALPFLSAYAGTKSMLDALSDGLRMELRPYGIHVLTYCPPSVATDFAQNAVRDPRMPAVSESGPKPASARDVAARIIRAVEAGKREVVEGRSLGWLGFFAPGLADNIFYKAMVLKFHRS